MLYKLLAASLLIIQAAVFWVVTPCWYDTNVSVGHNQKDNDSILQCRGNLKSGITNYASVVRSANSVTRVRFPWQTEFDCWSPHPTGSGAPLATYPTATVGSFSDVKTDGAWSLSLTFIRCGASLHSPYTTSWRST